MDLGGKDIFDTGGILGHDWPVIDVPCGVDHPIDRAETGLDRGTGLADILHIGDICGQGQHFAAKLLQPARSSDPADN